MTEFLNKIQHNIEQNKVRISEHGYDELAEDNLTVTEILEGFRAVKVLEKYPDTIKVLVPCFYKKIE